MVVLFVCLETRFCKGLLSDSLTGFEQDDSNVDDVEKRLRERFGDFTPFLDDEEDQASAVALQVRCRSSSVVVCRRVGT